MSDYWVSHKRYHCKYCNIYIADDKPSRTQHESGLRHKGNVERFVRGLYKDGEKRVREREEEKSIMMGVGKAAEAAYALDIASGRAQTSSASSSRSVPPPTNSKPKPAKPTNLYANYTTAAQLGYKDPDIEEAERRNGMGIPGEWTYVTPQTITSTPESESCQLTGNKTGDPVGEDAKASTDSAQNKKRAAAETDDDDMRAFKLRKKVVGPGLGDIFDPRSIPIKLKVKKGEQEATEEMRQPPSTPGTTSEPNTTTVPKWTKVQWEKVGGDGQSSTIKTESGSPPPPIIADPDPELAVSPAPLISTDGVKKEEDLPQQLSLDSVPTAGLFRKRKIPARRGA
ncbi:hypothetical protein V8B97DRAFT_1269642 [Scleroderma yunnanense]